MNISVYGFITLSSLINNTRDTDSVIGELSDEVRTYALDKGTYSNAQYPETRLISFRAKEDETDIVIPTDVKDVCIKLGDWCFKRAQDATFRNDQHAVRQAILAEFSTKVKDVVVGPMVISKGIYIPQYVEFKMKDAQTYQKSFIKLWFSDSALKAQYPFHDIVVVPITDNIDDFFLDRATILSIKENIDIAKIHNKANELKGRSPYTAIKTFNYKWMGEGEQAAITIPWTILVYGPVASNMDAIRQAIADWLMKHASKERSEWERIFPDIFIPTEFVIAPFWTIKSVQGYRLIASMYSPTIPLKDAIGFIKEAVPNYDPTHVENHAFVSSSLYKSLGFGVVGHPQNRTVSPDFYNVFPQYALIGSRTEDFNRLDSDTQDFIQVLNELFLVAEDMAPDSNIPSDISRVMRNNILYASKSHNGVDWLVCARYNYTKTDGLNGIRLPSETQ